MIESKSAAFFRKEGDVYVGNDPARGPWSEAACHAGPVTGIIVGALERAVEGKQLARVTLNFRRPVPIDGFTVAASLEREGRAASEASAVLVDMHGKTCAVATSMHLAASSFEGLPTATVARPIFEESGADDFPIQQALHGLPFFPSGIEVAYPPGETPRPGPTTMWMRTLPIVEGETNTPIQTLCPIADCGNAIGRNSEFTTVTCVNPDLTLTVHRPPRSDWLASRSTSFWEPSGIGLSQARLFDTDGPVGFALQTLLLRPLEPQK